MDVFYLYFCIGLRMSRAVLFRGRRERVENHPKDNWNNGKQFHEKNSLTD